MNRQQQKLRRLVNLTTTLLQSRRPLSAAELRKHVDDEAYAMDRSSEAFRRTFERDKADLVAMGIPLEVGKWQYGEPAVDHYFIDAATYAELDIGFEPEELVAIQLAIADIRLPEMSTAYVKTGLVAAGDPLTPAPSQSGGTPEPLADLPFEANVSPLASAAARQRAVKFQYSDSKRSRSQRLVEPWRVSFARGQWYAVGWDRRRDAQRTFRVDRIRGHVADAGPALHPGGGGTDPGDMKPWTFGTGEPVEVKILVDAELADYAVRRYDPEGSFQPDGSCLLTLQVRNTEALRALVLGMLGHAEVLEPQGVRDEIIDWLTPLV